MSALQCGVFIKTASYQVIEILGDAGLDFGVLDAEHAPLDRGAIDAMMVAGRACSLPLFVRIPDSLPASIQSVLDMGAAGILAPHVDTPEDARRIVSGAKFQGGTRGYSGSPRSAGYGSMSRDEIVRRGDSTKIICQIESGEAVRNVDAIAAVAGIDGVFLGRGDLALSLEVRQDDPIIWQAVDATAEAAKRHAKLFGVFLGALDELDKFRACGASWFIISSDQSMLKNAAKTAIRQVRVGAA